MSGVPPEKKKELIRRYCRVVSEYCQILDEIENLEDVEEEINPFVFPPLVRQIVIERNCAFNQVGSDGSLQLLTTPGERDAGIKELRDFTKGVESLIIVDPYFFSGNKDSAEQISKDFEKSARISRKDLKRVHVVYDRNQETKAVKTAITELTKNKGVKLSCKTSEEIHDRVWIADRSHALVVGTSLNGIGNRAAFLLRLPSSDFNYFLEFLDNRGLSRES